MALILLHNIGGKIMLDTEKTFLLARSIFKLGYIEEAKSLYENLLSVQPNHYLAKRELKKLNYII